MTKRFGIGTPAGRIGWDDLGKIAQGAAIAALGAIGAVVATWLTVEDVDFAAVVAAGTAAAFAVVVNSLRKFLTDTR